MIKWSLLIEDLPWSWKTTLSKAISKLLWFSFNRIHWTSDILPQDIIWWEYFNLNTKNIEIKKWPIFTELFLVDEINRMNPKTQSAFLQAMEEKKVSIMWIDYNLPKNFCVIATQNPIEYSWTFILPEAQKDRFYAKISLWNPTDELQLEIITNNFYNLISEKINNLEQIFDKKELDECFLKIQDVKISQEIAKRLVMFFNLIKTSDKIIYPISQRWISIFILACKANAFLNERDYIIPQDWLELLNYFLLHRLDVEKSSSNILNYLYKEAFINFR